MQGDKKRKKASLILQVGFSDQVIIYTLEFRSVSGRHGGPSFVVLQGFGTYAASIQQVLRSNFGTSTLA